MVCAVENRYCNLQFYHKMPPKMTGSTYAQFQVDILICGDVILFNPETSLFCSVAFTYFQH